ncbi:hypothetical protein L6164_005340 [Bauhinia variegata]|uniref:Uncharacterized protein n=1 Tax=Bauhinia variegata TaxID=167791 RepID=A0ACB9PQJ2_BAUVA|nr:hypothetical protein L6164_005340 [Bauhinia variegata]
MLKLVCFLFPLFLLFINSCASNSTSCHIDRCGSGPEIRYPFWLSHGSTPDQYCGYPEFGLHCSSDNGYPIFAPPPGLYYFVKEIDYVNRSIHLIDYDTANQTCPRALHHFPMGSLPLSHSPLNLNLSFHYNCSSYPSGMSSIRCLSSGVNESFVFLTGNETNGFQWEQNCRDNVVVAVLKDQITSNGLMNQFAGAMNEGFVLDWQTANDCRECEDSGGSCGYNTTRKEIMCYCKDGSVQSNDCKGGGGSGFHLAKLHIGLIAASGIGVLLICIALCYFRLRSSAAGQDSSSSYILID